MFDSQYYNYKYKATEQAHLYPKNVHLVSDSVLVTLLTRLSSNKTTQPQFNDILSYVYRSLIKIVINSHFPRKKIKIETRMIKYHKEALFETEVIDPTSKVVIVDLTRAGMLPSMVSFQYLNMFLEPEGVRCDHIYIERKTDIKGEVIGSNLAGYKIGGNIDGVYIILPDPMGATGTSLVNAISLYKEKVEGKPKKIIAIHLIITPEYIKYVTKQIPEILIYALRLDRGLSKEHIFKTIPGKFWAEERGLNYNQYIVPGMGGVGEIINNSYV